MNKILIIGSTPHEKVDNIKWTQPFPDIEKYDSLIIDLVSFPKNYPPTLFNNIGLLKRTARIFIRDNKEIFCIMDKPLKILFKKIPINYSWIPFPQKLTVNPMLLGRTINLIDERFSEYIENVEKWENELYWKNTINCSFDYIAINKSQNPIAATITINDRGKIHFLPKTTKISHSNAIKLLIDLATGEEPEEYQWLDSIEIPELNQIENSWNNIITPEKYRNLFSIDDKKITKAVQIILEDLGIKTTQTTEFDLTDLKTNIVVQITSTKGKVEAQNTKINQLARLIEKQRKNEKIIIIANTYKDLPINNRTNKEQIDLSMKIFLETNNAMFLTTLSLYHLWKKVITDQISTQEASSLIQNEIGEIEI
ncbi:MAG TPA: hypothetical protein VMX17_04485 [Candidatus Glassbacteria bacterium]|nr:hypothetical protein [Candidatus Glassbacteria bacterium]